ncbi:D-hexose-6-phosphate mutarotase [Colwelliaceae bacterium 6441]
MTISVLSSNAFGSVSQKKINDDVSVLNITHQTCQASLSLYGGHVLSWQPQGEKEVFWLSKKAEYQQGKAIRGGIPICWPWFGPNIDDQGVNGGNHGFARTNNWQLVRSDITAQNITLVLEFQSEGEHLMWPDKFKLQQTLVFAETFQQDLTMTNLSTQSVNFSSALHSYFSVSHPKSVNVMQLNRSPFDDKITAKKNQTDQLENCIGPIDRIYYCQHDQTIIDQQWHRQINVSSTHCQQWVLWNPGQEIADNMDDIHPQGENEFVCLEAANTQWQAINAGQSVTVAQHVKISRL